MQLARHYPQPRNTAQRFRNALWQYDVQPRYMLPDRRTLRSNVYMCCHMRGLATTALDVLEETYPAVRRITGKYLQP